MNTVTNKTNKPMKVPLPGGKVLRLAPGKSAPIVPKAAEFKPLLALVEAGEIELSDSARRASGGGAGGKSMRSSSERPGGIRHFGDR